MRVEIIFCGIVRYSLFGLIGKRTRKKGHMQILLFLSNTCINCSKR